MVKRNQGWERRIEITEMRRNETKQRKQRTADKRQQKLYAQELFSMIDRHAQRPFSLHVWTDCVAMDSTAVLEAVRADSSVKKGTRARSTSLNEYDESARGSNLLTGLRNHPRSNRKGRERSDSLNEFKSNSYRLDDECTPLRLCRQHFFFGKCQDSKGKKSGCRYHHFASGYKTLHDVLNTKCSSSDDTDKVVETAAAASDSVGQLDSQGMDVVHYLYIDTGSGSEDAFTSEDITRQLSVKEARPASIVYAVLNSTLIFDRYQEGLLVNDREFIALLQGCGNGAQRRLSIDEDELVAATVTSIPGSILEHTLTFLPDSAVAASSQVCKAWHEEIGRSPNIWRHLLQRRHWPLPACQEPEEELNRDAFRDAFLEHYTAIRDMNAIKSAIYALHTRKSQRENEMCYQDFSIRKFAPAASNTCVGVQVWSANRILVGYSHDCSLRLFECVPRDENEKLCRELICQSIDPYKNTKKRNCMMVAIDIDQDFIGCLCHVNADNVLGEAWILVVRSRENFLLGQSSAAMETNSITIDDRELKVIDVGEAVLNYLLSSDVVDHRLLQLIDFLVAGGQVGEIEVLVSHSLAACGDGRFMVEVTISIPSPPDEELDMDMLLVDRKLVLFSASAGAIVWIGESNDISKAMRPRHENMSLSHTRRPTAGSSRRQTCHVVVSSPVSADLLLSRIEPSGHVQSTNPIEAAGMVRLEVVDGDWRHAIGDYRPVVVTGSEIIAADVALRSIGDTWELRSTLSVYPLWDVEYGDLYRTIVLEGNLGAVRLTNMNDHHVLVLCRAFRLNGELGAMDVNVAAGAMEMLATRLPAEQVSLWAVCIHVPSGREIGRAQWLDAVGPEMRDVPIIAANQNGSTLGVGYAAKGVVMTGSDVRSVGQGKVLVLADAPTRSAQKKKKKKVVGKSQRKDGFMRGMSLRG